MSIDNICIHVLDDSFGSTLQIHVIIVHICIYAKPVCLKPAQRVGSKNAVFKQPNADRMAVPEYSSVWSNPERWPRGKRLAEEEKWGHNGCGEGCNHIISKTIWADQVPTWRTIIVHIIQVINYTWFLWNTERQNALPNQYTGYLKKSPRQLKRSTRRVDVQGARVKIKFERDRKKERLTENIGCTVCYTSP